MITNPQVGQTVYVINRTRVRAGKGVVKATITELVYTTCMGVRAVTVFKAGRSLYGTNDSYGSRLEAEKAGMEIASYEWELERERYQTIKDRLRKSLSQFAC